MVPNMERGPARGGPSGGPDQLDLCLDKKQRIREDYLSAAVLVSSPPGDSPRSDLQYIEKKDIALKPLPREGRAQTQILGTR